MAWSDPVGRASEIKDLPAAARLADDFANRLYSSPGMPADQADALERAIDVLHERFPELEDPELSQTARLKHQERKQKRKPRQKPRQGGQKARQGRGSRARSGRSGRRQGSRARAQRQFSRTGVPSAATSFTTIALQAVGLTIGLSLLYLLIVNGSRAKRGQSAVELLTTGIARSAHRLVAPVDPLAPRRVPSGARGKGSKHVNPTAVQP